MRSSRTNRVPALPPPVAPVACAVDPGERIALLDAGEEIRECYRVLRRGGLNVVGEVLRGQGDFIEYEQYPKDHVNDEASRAQYYYHAHRDSEREHGHFHTFIRTGLLTHPPPFESSLATETWPEDVEAVAHLVAIAMDDWGYPIELFTTNRWVTDETWYPAETVAGLVERFEIDHANPSWPVNRWITAMLRLFRPQIYALLEHRDVCVEMWRRAFPGQDVFEDRRLNIIGSLPIDVEAWLAELNVHSVDGPVS